MDDFWKVSAENYLNNVFYRREIDAKAASGDAFAAAVIATAASIAKVMPPLPFETASL